VKDYNRARTYLADLANRDGIPVFRGDINAALECVNEKLKTLDALDRRGQME
jgi:hypothetical protein